MKVTLVGTHQITKDEPIPLYGALGVLALASSVKEKSIECQVLDLIDYSRLGEKDFNPIFDEIADKIINTNAEVVGFSTTSDSLIIALDIAKKIKSKGFKILIVLGGPGVSYCSQEIIRSFSQVDFIIRGEADSVFPEFLLKLEGNDDYSLIKGLVTLKNGNLIDNGWPDPISDMNSLPIPAYEFCQPGTEKNQWFDNNHGFNIDAGRGCPYNCTFCSTSDYFKRKYRVKSVDRLIIEIGHVLKHIKNKRIYFNHDLLTFNRKYIEDLCEGIQEKYPDLKWGCSSRLDTIDTDLLIKMAKAGCCFIYFGIEVATKKMQKAIGKYLDLSKMDNVLESLKNANCDFVFSFVVGLPEEDIPDIVAMYNLAMKARSVCGDKCTIQMHPLIPSLGSKLYENYNADLIYDENNHTLDSSVALEWTELRNIIRNHPEIFARFYVYKNKLARFSSALADPAHYSFFSALINKILEKSLTFAYDVIGDSYAEIIIECFHGTNIAGANTYEETNFNQLFGLIHKNTIRKISEINGPAKEYDSIFKYESSVYEVSQKKSEDFIKIIEISHSESEILEIIEGCKLPEFNKNHNLLLFWDSSNSMVKCLEISPEIAKMGSH